MDTKTHYKKLRNPNYIGSYELMTGGTPIEMVVQIASAVKEQVQNGDKKEEAMVVYLNGQKPMIVNSTNAKAITAALGSPYIEDWVGKCITLYVAKIRAFGENVDALRVKKEAPVTAPVILPEFLPSNKNWQSAIDKINSGSTTLERSLDVIQSNYSISQETLKLFKDAIK